MAPSPAAGKGAPETPTKAGKNPASSTTPTLGKAADQAKDTAASAQKKTPGKPPKLGASKANTPKAGTTDSPKLPPRPKEAEKSVEDVKGKAPATEAAAEETESEAGKIAMNDNDPRKLRVRSPNRLEQRARQLGTLILARQHLIRSMMMPMMKILSLVQKTSSTTPQTMLPTMKPKKPTPVMLKKLPAVRSAVPLQQQRVQQMMQQTKPRTQKTLLTTLLKMLPKVMQPRQLQTAPRTQPMTR
jgi:hypothetical protein